MDFKEINLREILNKDKHSYNNFIDEYTDILLKDYRMTIREYTYNKMDDSIKSPFLKDKIIKINCDGEEYEATHGNTLSILILFTILNKIKNRNGKIEDLNKYIFDPSSSSSFENIIDVIYIDYINFPDIKNLIFESVSQLAKVSAMFTSGTISLRDIYMIRKNNPEFEEILNFNVSRTDSFATMIQKINNNKNLLQDFLTNTDSSYRPMILSNSGFNFKQASQIFNLIGPKPDVFGNMHSHAILTNFLNGLKSIDDYYVNADNARKALIVNFTNVKDSGYLTRILSMLCLDIKLANVEQCKTAIENLPDIFIKNEFILEKYKHRNMWDGEKYVKIGNNKDLIGKTIKVASPMTCSCTSGICHNCYGELYKTISTKKLSDGRTIEMNIGLIAVLLLTEVLTQSLLSTKHLLEANTDELDWNGLNKYFEIYSNNMSLKEEYNLNNIIISELDDEYNICKLSINNNEFTPPVPLELNKMYNLVKYNTENDLYKISIDSENNSNDEFNSNNNHILFNFKIKNKELSEPLKKIGNLINSDRIKDRDLNGNINYMMDLLDNVGFKISSEHIEVIMRELILIDSRKDFECVNPEYTLVSARGKVLKSSITKSFLFERLETQLLNLNTYLKNNTESLLDFLL